MFNFINAPFNVTCVKFRDLYLRTKEYLIQTVVWFEQLRDPIKNIKNTSFDELIYSLI